MKKNKSKKQKENNSIFLDIGLWLLILNFLMSVSISVFYMLEIKAYNILSVFIFTFMQSLIFIIIGEKILEGAKE